MDHRQPRRIEERVARHLLLIAALLVLALAQATLLPAPFGFPLNPLLILVALLTVLLGVGVGAQLAFYSGIALDLVSAVPLGSHALALLLAVALVAATTRWFHRDNLLLPLVAVAMAAACYELSLAALYQLAMNWAEWRAYALDVVVPITLFATIPALPCFLVLRVVTRRRDALDISGGRL